MPKNRQREAGRMKMLLGGRLTAASTVVWALAGAAALAETNTYCDEKCGDSKACQYTCCSLTTTTIGGVPIITGVNCSSSICCAHPVGVSAGALLQLPDKQVEGAAGPVKWGLAGIKDLDASTISVESDAKARTVTIRGTVKSAAERDVVDATARKQARAFKILNQLAIVK
jgi:hypothetical protein